MGLNSTILDLDYRKDGLNEFDFRRGFTSRGSIANMELNFDAETDQGTISFRGNLGKDEVDFLLRFAILSLMARGTLPVQVVNPDMIGEDGIIKPEKLH